jgi:hypothetical protein
LTLQTLTGRLVAGGELIPRPECELLSESLLPGRGVWLRATFGDVSFQILTRVLHVSRRKPNKRRTYPSASPAPEGAGLLAKECGGFFGCQ